MACVSAPPIGRRQLCAPRPLVWLIALGSTRARDAARESAHRSRLAHWTRSTAAFGLLAAPVALRALSAAVDSSTCFLISTLLLRELSRNQVSKKTLGRRITEGARDHHDAWRAHARVRASSAASPAARHPTSGTTRETHQAWPQRPLATCPARSGTHAACGAPRRHTMPPAPAAGKRGGSAGRTSVSQSLGPTGHCVRCTFAEGC